MIYHERGEGFSLLVGNIGRPEWLPGWVGGWVGGWEEEEKPSLFL